MAFLWNTGKRYDVIDGKNVPLLRCVSVDLFENHRINMIFWRIMDQISIIQPMD